MNGVLGIPGLKHLRLRFEQVSLKRINCSTFKQVITLNLMEYFHQTKARESLVQRLGAGCRKWKRYLMFCLPGEESAGLLRYTERCFFVAWTRSGCFSNSAMVESKCPPTQTNNGGRSVSSRVGNLLPGLQILLYLRTSSVPHVCS